MYTLYKFYIVHCHLHPLFDYPYSSIIDRLEESYCV